MPASPILLLVPYRSKATVLYSQIPTSASASGDMVVSRAGVSTRVNAQGNIESVSANVPRLNYPLGGIANGCPALLVEPSGTNLCLQSEAFNTTWTFVTGGTGVNPTITTNAVISPDGTQNAETVVFNRGAGNLIADQSSLQQNITIPTSGAYIFSVYAKASTAGDVGKQIFLRIGNAGVLTAITLTANWARYSRAEVPVASGSQPVQIGNRGTATLDNSVSADLWGAQAEAGLFATSYIPTTTGTVTRNADVVTNNTFVIPNLLGAILTEFDSPTSGTYFLDNLPIPISSGTNKIAISYTPTTLTIYRNGAQVSGSPVTPPGGTASIIGNVINIGHNNQLYQLGSGIKSFVLYSTTLSAAEASGLTT